MNIVQLANFYSPTSGGLRVAVDTFAAGYRSAGHECTTIVPGPVDSVRDGRCTIKSPLLPGSTGYRVMLRRQVIRNLLESLGPDQLEVHDKLLLPWLWKWSRAHGVALVLVSHERLGDTLPLLVPVVPARLSSAVGDRITRNAAVSCDSLVTCSKYAAADFGSVPVHVVPLGVDLSAFAVAPGHGTERARLVVCSRLSAEKRVDLALDAVRLLTGRGAAGDLRVLGAGPLLPGLRSRYPEVDFAGFVSREQVAAELAGADVVLAPGPAETFGLAALEALASGTPIVTVAGCATAELIADAPLAGRAAAPTADAFADAVQEVLRIPRNLRSAAARARAEDYTWSAAVTAMIAVHQDVAAMALR